ncbi:unnamed protein product [Cochlearia groenlandica]
MANNNNTHTDDLDELLDKSILVIGCFLSVAFSGALDDFKDLNLTQSDVQGLGMGLPDMRSKKKGKQQKATKEDHVAEALNKLREQTRETVKGLESLSSNKQQQQLPPGTDDAMVEDWIKQFEDMAGSQDLESIVDTMMQQLLSKDILHEPMKEIGARYPEWLEEHETSIEKEEFERYSRQYELIKELTSCTRTNQTVRVR